MSRTSARNGGLLSVSDAATTAGTTTETIRSWFDSGEVQGRRNHLGYRLVEPGSLERRLSSVGTGEAAKVLELSEQTIRAMFDQGDLAGYRTASGHRRIFREALTKAVEEEPPAPSEDN